MIRGIEVSAFSEYSLHIYSLFPIFMVGILIIVIFMDSMMLTI